MRAMRPYHPDTSNHFEVHYNTLMTCPVCEGPRYHPMTGTCPDHIDYLECEECKSLMPMVEGIYTEGTPDVYYLWNGDPGYPGDPPELQCVACPLFSDGWNMSHSVDWVEWADQDEDGNEVKSKKEACIECGITSTQRGMEFECYPESPEEPEYPDDSLEGHCVCHDAAVCPDEVENGV